MRREILAFKVLFGRTTYLATIAQPRAIALSTQLQGQT